jgi:hypothetical protein
MFFQFLDASFVVVTADFDEVTSPLKVGTLKKLISWHQFVRSAKEMLSNSISGMSGQISRKRIVL